MTRQGIQKLIPENLRTHLPVELQEAHIISTSFLRIGTVVAVIMCSGVKSITFEYRIPYVTLLAWERSNRREYHIRDIPMTSPMLKLNQYIKNTQEHSVVLFVRTYKDETSDTGIPNLDDISRIEWEDEEPGDPPSFFPPDNGNAPPPGGGNEPGDNGNPPDDGNWWLPSAFDPGDAPQQPPNNPGEGPPQLPPGPPPAPLQWYDPQPPFTGGCVHGR